MTTGSSDTRRFSKFFQVRWAEKLGHPEDPYLIRWTFILFGFSIRIHHWLKSDDRRFFHDHSSNLLSVVLKGEYENVTPVDPTLPPGPGNEKRMKVRGMFNSLKDFFRMSSSIWFSKAEQQHYLDIPKGGAWTLMFEGRPRRKWGFYVPRKTSHKWFEHPESSTAAHTKLMRPILYFKRYGIAQDAPYQ